MTFEITVVEEIRKTRRLHVEAEDEDKATDKVNEFMHYLKEKDVTVFASFEDSMIPHNGYDITNVRKLKV